MKIVQINTFPYKATGSIMMSIYDALTEQGFDSYVVWGRGRDSKNANEIVIKDELGTKLHGVYTRLTDRTGFASNRATQKLLTRLDEIQPDIIHLHNIHGYYLNIEMLFGYIRQHRTKVVWTLHDCWAFTGHCAYFDAVGCDRWKTGCYHCPQKKTYPASALLDASAWNWQRKKELFTGLDMVVVTPSNWLAGLVRESFLGEYPIEVIHNGIDTEIFRPRKGAFREKYGIDKKIILGVAAEWTDRKGLRDFIKLNDLIDRNVYQIVLIGLTKKQIEELPGGILGLQRTSSPEELAEIYSDAYVFFNPTYEDNYPTTNLEAMACGTPVVTYDTGGSPESVWGRGVVVEKGKLMEAVGVIQADKIMRINLEKVEDSFSKWRMVDEYVRLYSRLERAKGTMRSSERNMPVPIKE